MKRGVVILFIFVAAIVAHAGVMLNDSSTLAAIEGPVLGLDSVKCEVDSAVNGDDEGWFRQLVKKRFNVNDTTINFPPFLEFCADVYRWGDRTFNSYDTTYVFSCPQKWKVMLKARTKFDTYHVNVRHANLPGMIFNTQARTTAGFRASFMAVGFEYMPDIDNLLSGRIIDHRLTRISFTCSRFFAELYYNKNSGTSHINKFGSYNNGKLIVKNFDGLTSKTLGLDVFYVFNHKKYAHAAAYCFSKIQRRSAGSFILGVQYANQKLALDFTNLPEELVPHKPWPDPKMLHHYDYAINVGYAYSWVFHRNWVVNIMTTPSFGLNHTVVDNIDAPTNKLAFNVRARMALVRNAGNFFYALNASFNGYFSWSKSYMLYNQINDASITAGLRF